MRGVTSDVAAHVTIEIEPWRVGRGGKVADRTCASQGVAAVLRNPDADIIAARGACNKLSHERYLGRITWEVARLAHHKIARSGNFDVIRRTVETYPGGCLRTDLIGQSLPAPGRQIARITAAIGSRRARKRLVV